MNPHLIVGIAAVVGIFLFIAFAFQVQFYINKAISEPPRDGFYPELPTTRGISPDLRQAWLGNRNHHYLSDIGQLPSLKLPLS